MICVDKLFRCQPFSKQSDIRPLITNIKHENFTFIGDDELTPANPCGARAVSFFNDTYTLEFDKVPVPIREHDISQSAYRKNVFLKNSDNKQWLDVTNGRASPSIPSPTIAL